ncbi:hypothetical protein PAHAL_9G509100 [Panicum hallii]|uniref:Uncharacterized protein n=1 Tax=Panicum hallii TaxID=206008 RepID=A0A2T8I5C1_9POAL|nr:hypothetical protein PAHAL_9G509100 [Panicum hallii]
MDARAPSLSTLPFLASGLALSRRGDPVPSSTGWWLPCRAPRHPSAPIRGRRLCGSPWQQAPTSGPATLPSADTIRSISSCTAPYREKQRSTDPYQPLSP